MAEKTKPITPYQRLRDSARIIGSKILHPRRTHMFTYDAKKVTDRVGFRIDDLAERVQAANQLGYDVRVTWSDAGLSFHYVERIDVSPMSFIWN